MCVLKCPRRVVDALCWRGLATNEIIGQDRIETFHRNALHCLHGPALVVKGYQGSPAVAVIEEWWVEGKRHRLGAIEVNGRTEWWANDKLHNPNGPAVVKRDGRQQWWINGVRQPDCHQNHD